jgi:hypothetical protein
LASLLDVSQRSFCRVLFVPAAHHFPTSCKAYTETGNFAAVQVFHRREDLLLVLECNAYLGKSDA